MPTASMRNSRASGSNQTGSGYLVGLFDNLYSQAMMKVQEQVIATSITVLESNDMPFLFGLDMLRRHACQVRLSARFSLDQRNL